ncbi:PP2C family serine/threonine-protein phosphatase [uncultured Acetatifactor sp.]|uniref:PP2C family protein-serine/threonine phosphatase n=1 Tax=uncultured Acetatifactor sp. TaxID=1671927 RepID=UPI00260E09E2|nr:PP2C family serine/threonine-protein phosphatase [uncultured Acetatifactor sp.]
MRGIWIAGVAALAGLLSVGVRLALSALDRKKRNGGSRDAGQGADVAVAQTTGSKEIQADQAQFLNTMAGTMAVLVDGIGNKNTGKLCAQLAVDTILDHYEQYHVLHNPEYFFKTVFYEANCRIQRTIGDRRGGASAGAVFLGQSRLHYALAGDIRIAVLRHGELIPLSRGQTMDVLAAEAWREGKIARQEALWSMEEKRIWNYVGMDGFRELEICEQPIRLKDGDIVLMASRGIFEEMSWGEMEDLLVSDVPLQEAAERMVRAAEMKPSREKDNGSVVLIKARVEMV